MDESYVEYLLSRCSDVSISRSCDLFQTKEDLICAARNGFNGNDHILWQGLIVFAAEDLIAENGYITNTELGKDAQKVLHRFIGHLDVMKAENKQHRDIDKEQMFNVMTDLIWLLSSKYCYEHNEFSRKIELLTSQPLIRTWAKKALKGVLYDMALYDKERSEQYESAQLMRYQILSGCHPDQQVRELYSQGYTCSDFKLLQAQARECSIRRMALFYALTATLSREEEIRRTR